MKFRLPPFYTARYVEVHSPLLSALWMISGVSIVLYTLVHSLLGQHSYVHREVPNMDVTFWQDHSVDGTWWPVPESKSPPYCDTSFRMESQRDGTSWGSDKIGCKRPSETPGTYFYPSSNQMQVAFSIAYGSDPQYNTSEVYIYEGIGESTLGLQLSFITSREHISHVQNCRVIGDEQHPEGYTVGSRYEDIFPNKDYGEGYLLLSVNDVMRAVGRNLETGSVNDAGSEVLRYIPQSLKGIRVLAPQPGSNTYLVDTDFEDNNLPDHHPKHRKGIWYRTSMNLDDHDAKHFAEQGSTVKGEMIDGWLDVHGNFTAPLRLSGMEIVAKFDLRNYHRGFAWPLWWNPLGFTPASDLECTVRFDVLRDQFTPLQWFYQGTTPVALQHGLRLVAVGSGSIGYFSFVELFEKLLLGFAAFGLAQVVLDLGWYYLFSEADAIACQAYEPVKLGHGSIRGLPRMSPKSNGRPYRSGSLPFFNSNNKIA